MDKKSKLHPTLKKWMLILIIWITLLIAGFVELCVTKRPSNIWFVLGLGTFGFFSWKIIVWIKRGLMFIGTGGKSF
jgi:hypothetical protein